MNKYQYIIDRCCGGPCINRKPLVKKETAGTLCNQYESGISKELRQQKLDAIESEYQREFGREK